MFRLGMVAIMCVSLFACKSEDESVAKTPNVIDHSVIADPNSYAQTDKVLIEHIRLNLAVDMPKKILKGSADLELNWLDKEAKELILDTRDLKISAIQGGDGKTWRNLKYKLAAADADFGSALHIKMPSPLKRVRITYQTSPDASGLQ